MKLLILGGTVFLGRELVDAALARDHYVTIFHRGETGADLIPELEVCWAIATVGSFPH